MVFKLAPAGTETVLYSFTGGADGAFPGGVLLRDTAGNLYGTTERGGANSSACEAGTCGVVFKVSPDGAETMLHTFTGGGDGGNPYAGLLRDTAGNLYGTTLNGGAYGLGVVFRLAPDGTETVLHSFAGGGEGANPGADLIQDGAGNLYGTTLNGGAYGAGVVFKLTP